MTSSDSVARLTAPMDQTWRAHLKSSRGSAATDNITQRL
jgi:hypothetical protein